MTENMSIEKCSDAVLLNSPNKDRRKEDVLDPIEIDRTILFVDCLGVGLRFFCLGKSEAAYMQKTLHAKLYTT